MAPSALSRSAGVQESSPASGLRVGSQCTVQECRSPAQHPGPRVQECGSPGVQASGPGGMDLAHTVTVDLVILSAKQIPLTDSGGAPTSLVSVYSKLGVEEEVRHHSTDWQIGRIVDFEGSSKSMIVPEGAMIIVRLRKPRGRGEPVSVGEKSIATTLLSADWEDRALKLVQSGATVHVKVKIRGVASPGPEESRSPAEEMQRAFAEEQAFAHLPSAPPPEDHRRLVKVPVMNPLASGQVFINLEVLRRAVQRKEACEWPGITVDADPLEDISYAFCGFAGDDWGGVESATEVQYPRHVLRDADICLRQLQRLQVEFPGQLNTELPMLLSLCQLVQQGEMPYLPALGHAVQTGKRITLGLNPDDPLIVAMPVWGWVESCTKGLKKFLMSNECWEAWAWEA